MKTMNKLNVNGQMVEAIYREEDIETIFKPLLERWYKMYQAKKKRIIVGLAACPGSGKSTLSLFLETLFCALYKDVSFQSIGMDGFHYTNQALKEKQLLNEKGSPNTFDVYKLKEYIIKTKKEDCFWPAFSRIVHEPVENEVFIQSDIVLIEGNYLLSEESPWNEIGMELDDTVFMYVDKEILKERLIQRKSLSIGYEKACLFYENSDSKNIDYVLNTKRKANVEFTVK